MTSEQVCQMLTLSPGTVYQLANVPKRVEEFMFDSGLIKQAPPLASAYAHSIYHRPRPPPFLPSSPSHPLSPLPYLLLYFRVELDSLDTATCTPTPRISRYVQGDDADESGTQVRHPLRRLVASERSPCRLVPHATAFADHCGDELQGVRLHHVIRRLPDPQPLRQHRREVP